MNMTHATGTGDGHQAGGPARAGSRRHVAFWVAGATLTLFLCGASAPSPLYAIYQAKLGFSATVLTAIFAVYAVAVLVTVLPAGELSDQIGYCWERTAADVVWTEAVVRRLVNRANIEVLPP